MSIIPKVTSPIAPKVKNAFVNFSKNPKSAIPKALGIASVAAVIYDSHINGKERAIVTDDIESADRFSRQFQDYMTSTKDSATVCKLKKHWFDIQQSFPLYHPISRAKGYIDAFGSTAIRELPVLALSAVSLVSKGILCKAAGVLLALNGVRTVVCDVIGIGSKTSGE